MFLGEHKSYLYDSIERKHCILFSNLLYGINAGCSALYITSGESVDKVKAGLRNFGLKIDNPQKLKIVSSHQWYTPDGDFNARRVVDQYKSLIDNVIDRGFSGLYVSADASDTYDFLSKKGMGKEWIAYENSLGTIFKFPMEAICAYRAEQIISNLQMLLQILISHRNTLSFKTGKDILNNQLIRSSIFYKFKEIFGKTMTMLVFDYIDSYILKQNLYSPDYSLSILIPILKELDSRVLAHIEQNILEEICARLEVM